MRTTILLLAAAIISQIFFDVEVANFFHLHEDSSLHYFFQGITDIGKSLPYFIIGALLYYIFRKKNSELALFGKMLFLSVLLSGVAANIIKFIFGRWRPKALLEDGLYGYEWFEVGYIQTSFPSGHSATMLSVTVLLSLFLPRLRYPFILFGVLIALSRVVINAHFLSDVIVGSLIGILSSLYIYKRYRN